MTGKMYEAPEVEIYPLLVEQGFSLSGNIGDSMPDYGEGSEGYEQEME